MENEYVFEENSYGVKWRYLYISSLIEKYKPKYVLDFGCGTGEHLTFPLAKKFDFIDFIGIDNDDSSIKYACEINNLNNLKFYNRSLDNIEHKFDLIIASEVLEHLDNPNNFLYKIHFLLKYKGILIVTIPNGNGPFEMATLLQSLIYWGVLNHIVRIKRYFFGYRSNISDGRTFLSPKDTLAFSPHQNFFSLSKTYKIFHACGWKVIEVKPKTFLCGYILDWIIRLFNSYEWNVEVSKKIPLILSSGWMMLCESNYNDEIEIKDYDRSRIERVRKYIYAKGLKYVFGNKAQ